MALIQTVMRRGGHVNVDSHGLEISPEGEVFLGDVQDDWDSLFAETEIHYGDVTDVDVPALPALGDTTLPDLPALPDDLTEEVEPTLLDTPALTTPYLTPANAMAPVHPPLAERLPDTPLAPPTLSPWRARQTPAPRAPKSTPGNGSKRLTRTEREALARVIALAKPRTSTTRTSSAARFTGTPTRTPDR
jgi:hypothetical protein